MYHNKQHRAGLWRQLSDEFGDEFDGVQLSKKWSNLRIQYRNYAAKQKETKSGQGSNEGGGAIKWKYFDAMKFISRAEEEQTTATKSNFVYDTSTQSSVFETQQPPITMDVPTAQQTRRARARSSSSYGSGRSASASSVDAMSSTATVSLTESMKEAIVLMRERKASSDSGSNVNAMFAQYIKSELDAMTAGDAQLVRSALTATLMQKMSENQANQAIAQQQQQFIIVRPDDMADGNAENFELSDDDGAITTAKTAIANKIEFYFVL